MPQIQSISRGFQALRQLGLAALAPYVWYQLKLRSGALRLATPVIHRWRRRYPGQPQTLFELPDRGQLATLLGEELKQLYQEADEILGGQVRLFGGPPQALVLDPGATRHWSAYSHQLPDGSDIKLVWEPGRFGWATVLARAYWLSGDERYAEGFWSYLEEFLQANPPNQGPHWSSAQEVALRLMALGFCCTVLEGARASTVERKYLLGASLATHAERIPPSLSYALAQNNNHLLSEALGLYTAAALLPDHPHREYWRHTGQRLFRRGLLRQIDTDGAYNQHSANYQRLMLQLALWAELVAARLGDNWPALVRERLAAATRWLGILLDRDSGCLPNLGPNDGAYILPLTTRQYEDYRPVLQAASRRFLGEEVAPNGPWDEMDAWLRPASAAAAIKPAASIQPLRLEGRHSWAYLRTARFRGRPGHADQLHLDLWHRGDNIALDPGSYRYKAAAPWDNALAGTAVHNTLTVNGIDQMQRAGRFLWLNWAQATVLEQSASRVLAQHDGYRRLGLLHQREVHVVGDEWLVIDQLLPTGDDPAEANARLHWLLPDWPYTYKAGQLTLKGPGSQIELSIEGNGVRFSLLRAGEVLEGELRADPVLGWFSPSYDQKVPALSLLAEVGGLPPLELRSQWSLG